MKKANKSTHKHKPYLVTGVMKNDKRMEKGAKDYNKVIFWCGECSKEYVANR